MSGGGSPPAIPDGASPEAAADRVLAVLRPVCGALVLGVVALAGVAAWLFVQGTAPLAAGAVPPLALWIIAGVAASLFVVAPVLERSLREAPRGASPSEVAARYQTGTMVGFAVREAPGLMGVVVSLLVGSLVWAAGFALASVVAMTLAWPRRDDLVARLRRASARH